jgi:hypothetical protein
MGMAIANPARVNKGYKKFTLTKIMVPAYNKRLKYSQHQEREAQQALSESIIHKNAIWWVF